MRVAEARVTLAVVAARQGDVEKAVHYGERALDGQRKSLPSLAMVTRDLARVLKRTSPTCREAGSYLDQLDAYATLPTQRHEGDPRATAPAGELSP